MVPVNMHIYYLDLNEANEKGANLDSISHLWKKQYDFKTEYGLPDMSPTSFQNLFKRFSEEPDLLNQYKWNEHAKATARPTKTKADPSVICEAAQNTIDMRRCVEEIDGTGIRGWYNFFRRVVFGG